MAADDGNPADLLRQKLEPALKVAHRTGFFTLVSLLERMTTDAVRIGGEGPASEEAIRFRHHSGMVFNPGDIHSAMVRSIPRDPENPMGPSRAVVEVVTTFLGLTGSSSPLPLYLVDEVNKEDEEIGARRDFLDVFHHRLISILYRSVSRYSPAREHRSEGRDFWLERSLALAGMDPESYVPGCGIAPGKLMRLAPLVARRGRGARALDKALKVVLDEHLGPAGRVKVEEFAGGWVSVHQDQRCALGKDNNLLGRNAMLGMKVFDRSGRFQVSVGPLDAFGRKEFSENGPAMRKLRACISLVVPEPLDYDVELHIAAGATRPFCLSCEQPSRLGENTRLGRIQEGEIVKLRNMGNYSPSQAPDSAEA